MAYSQPMSRRRRATALGLTIAIHILVALIIWNLPPNVFFRPTSDTLSTFDVASSSGEAPQAAAAPQAERRPKRAEQRPSPPQTIPPPPQPQVEFPIPDFMRMTRDQFAATDVSRLPKTATRRDGTDDGPAVAAATGSGRNAGDSTVVPGAGPGGARVFRAEWVREPTEAELQEYIKSPPIPSWGMVVCRSIPGNRVENCQLVGENPPGSHLATGVRRAAWQFQVRPPRLNGKPLIGEWIQIRISYTERGIGAD